MPVTDRRRVHSALRAASMAASQPSGSSPPRPQRVGCLVLSTAMKISSSSSGRARSHRYRSASTSSASRSSVSRSTASPRRSIRSAFAAQLSASAVFSTSRRRSSAAASRSLSPSGFVRPNLMYSSHSAQACALLLVSVMILAPFLARSLDLGNGLPR